MGKNMVLHLLDQGVEVVAWNRSPEKAQELKTEDARQRRGSPKAARV